MTVNASLLCSNFFVENKYYGTPEPKRSLPLQVVSCRSRRKAALRLSWKNKAQRENCDNRNTPLNLLVDKGHVNMLNGFVDAIYRIRKRALRRACGWCHHLAPLQYELRQPCRCSLHLIFTYLKLRPPSCDFVPPLR